MRLAPHSLALDIKTMNRRNIQILVIIFISITSFGCSIPKNSYSLIPPAGLGKVEQAAIRKQCMQEPSKLADIPLTEKESNRIGNIETCRSHEGGRGRSISCDRYILCFLNRDYQLLVYPAKWFSQSECELLDTYKTAGIEKERLKYFCKSKNTRQCDACK